MESIINEIKEALVKDGVFFKNLKEVSKICWQENYPVAVVHEKIRVKDENNVVEMEKRGFFDEEGKTAHHYDNEDINFLKKSTPNYIKTVSLLGKKIAKEEGYLFKEKYEHDYWKKIENRSDFRAVVETSHYEDETLCEIEVNLRDIMRSSKEVPSVKVIGFVWIANVPILPDLTKVMQHYFLNNHALIEKNNRKIYLGWSPTLKEVNMRYFVCPPS